MTQLENQQHINSSLTQNNIQVGLSPEDCLKWFERAMQKPNKRLSSEDNAGCIGFLRRQKCNIDDDDNLATEMIFTYSKEWSDERKNPTEYAKRFMDKTLEAIRKKHGKESVISAVMHLDEETPHLHVILAPIAKATTTNRHGSFQRVGLSHASLFVDEIPKMKAWRAAGTTDKNSKLGKLQTYYAQELKSLGIVRGERNAWYKRHNPPKHPQQQPEKIQQPELPALIQEPENGKILAKVNNFVENITKNSMFGEKIAITPEQLKYKLQDFYIDTSNNMREKCRKSMSGIIEIASMADTALKENEKLQRENSELKQFAKEKQKMANKYYSQAEKNKIRDLDLAMVCNDLGLQYNSQYKAWYSGDMQTKIIIDPKNPHNWTDVKNPQGKTAGGSVNGAIDLIMHINRCDFYNAMSWASAMYGKDTAVKAATYKAQNEIKEKSFEWPKPSPFHAPKRSTDKKKIEKAKKYMFKRGIEPETIEELFQNQQCYVSEQGDYTNLVFYSGGKSAEIKGIGTGYSGLALGSSRVEGPAFMLDCKNADTLTLTEAAFDAISYKQLYNPNEIICSVSGVGMGTEAEWIIKMVKERGIKLINIAYDSDKAGWHGFEVLNAKIATIPGVTIAVKMHEIPKNCKDWNDIVMEDLPEQIKTININKDETLQQMIERLQRQMEKQQENEQPKMSPVPTFSPRPH